jgi:hypothetical protein
MSKRYRDWVRANSTVRGSARCVLNILADYASDEGLAWPGHAALAKESGLSERTVIRCAQKLVAIGAIERVSGGDGRGDMTRYRVLEASEKGDKRVTECHVSDTQKGDNVTQKGDNVTQKGDNVTESTYTRELEPEEPEVEPEPPAAAPVPESPPERDPFLVAYESIWGRVPASEYEGGRIADWAERVTLDGWKYALTESAAARAANWKYVEAILRRIEREGYTPPDAAPVAVSVHVAYTLEDVYA